MRNSMDEEQACCVFIKSQLANSTRINGRVTHSLELV